MKNKTSFNKELIKNDEGWLQCPHCSGANVHLSEPKNATIDGYPITYFEGYCEHCPGDLLITDQCTCGKSLARELELPPFWLEIRFNQGALTIQWVQNLQKCDL